jgi:ribosomal-protein-alanine N-acetyltransferase
MSDVPGGVQIRRMTFLDLDRVIEIAEGLRDAPRWPRSSYVDALNPDSRPPRIGLLAETAAGGIVGFVIAVLVPPQAEMESIAVAMEYQRQGIALKLFHEIAAELKRSHVTEVILEVRASNQAARALYGTLGFAETGRRARYYAEPQEDAVLMRTVLI